MESHWLTLAKRLLSIGETGLHYSKDLFDDERYEQVTEIAKEMLASLASVPVERFDGLLGSSTQGYATPKVDVRGAVIVDSEILLVKERNDGRWAMPGGYGDVGFSAAENVEREILEEANIAVEATRLFSIRHKGKGLYGPDVHDCYKLFFLCTPVGDSEGRPGPETSAVQYFKIDELPELSIPRVIERDILEAFAFSTDPNRAAVFD